MGYSNPIPVGVHPRSEMTKDITEMPGRNPNRSSLHSASSTRSVPHRFDNRSEADKTNGDRYSKKNKHKTAS